MAIGDFNLSAENSQLKAFIQAYDFRSIIKKSTCYQTNTPSWIDLILTNRNSLFKLFNMTISNITNNLKFEIEKIKTERYGKFEVVSLKELDKHAPLEKKIHMT